MANCKIHITLDVDCDSFPLNNVDEDFAMAMNAVLDLARKHFNQKHATVTLEKQINEQIGRAHV